MTELDAIILTTSAILAAFAVATDRGVGLAFIVFLGFVFNEWAFTVLDLSSYESFYETGANWMSLVAAKDLIIIGLLSYRLRRSEVWLILIFGASFIFHLWCRKEFNSADVDLMSAYDIRFNFMQIIAALQLTGVITNFTWGDWSGGKLARLRFHRIGFLDRLSGSDKAFKAIK